MSFERHLPVINSSGLYTLNNNSNSSITSSLNININDHYSNDPSITTSNPSSSPSFDDFVSSTTHSTSYANHGLIPTHLHHWSYEYSILSIAIYQKNDVSLLFAGTQDSKILICDLNNYQLLKTIETDHNGSILNLIISNNDNYLFSTSSDSLIKIWDISKLSVFLKKSDNINLPETEIIKEISTIYSLLDIGDIFSIALSKTSNILFFGTQNASIQWINLSDKSNFIKINKKNLNKLPFLRFDKFFDSKPGVRHEKKELKISTIITPEINEKIEKYSNTLEKKHKNNLSLIEIPLKNVISFAHNGFIYDMKIVSRIEVFPNGIDDDKESIFSEYLISAGGDGLIKIWGINKNYDHQPIKLLKILDNEEQVMSMTIHNFFLYCGLLNGKIKVWDLSTFQFIKLIDRDTMGEINSLRYYPDLNCLFKGTELGCCKYNLFNNQNNDIDWNSNDDSVLAVDILYNQHNKNNHNDILITAGNSGISIWDLPKSQDYNEIKIDEDEMKYLISDSRRSQMFSNKELFKLLNSLISFKTISKQPELYIEDSRNCANFLNSCFKIYGANETKLLPVKDGNPIVYALFKANNHHDKSPPPRVLWYGHYDVVETENDKGWNSDPFSLVAKDGYLFARGVTDNKGPLLSSLFSISELYHNKQLNSDVVFLIEGEEESGSFGFQNIIKENRSLIGNIDWILFSNTYWLDDKTPCLNYGLRGLISIELEISSAKPDRHSGMDGGVSREPTIDLINLLSTLTDGTNGKVLIPEFYEPISSITKKELKLYEDIIEKVDGDELTIKNLLHKWRLPSLTVHKLKVSGPKNSTIIPQIANTSISMRLVPEQDISKIQLSFLNHIEKHFHSLNTSNTLKIKFLKKTEAWIGDLNNELYQTLQEEITNQWGIEPLFVREGGSIPSIRFLEKFFNANAAQIPCGQSSDNAHLNNERLRIMNLFALKDILTNVFKKVPANKNKVVNENYNNELNNNGSLIKDEYVLNGDVGGKNELEVEDMIKNLLI